MERTVLSRFMVPIAATFGSALCCHVTIAQVTPDQTLPAPSIVTSNNSRSVITGGTQAGNNLFHSFWEFSVPVGAGAIFNNALNIQNIIARVTGGRASTIDGLIQTNGTASLFLLNPNGIIFGEKATLNISGSFFVTTASGLRFPDGTVFSTDPTQPALLSVTTPLGIQWGNNAAGTITNAGILQVGQNLTIAAEQISSPGSLTANGIVLQAKQSIQTGVLSSGSGNVLIESEFGKIDAGPITATALNAGDITLIAAGNITTSSISTIGVYPSDAFDDISNLPDSKAGRISLQSTNGAIDTRAGTLITSAGGQSGGIALKAAGDIQIGDLTTDAQAPLPGYPQSVRGTPIFSRGILIETPGRLQAIGLAEKPVQIVVTTTPGRGSGYVGAGPIDIIAKDVEFNNVQLTNQSKSDTTFTADRLSFTRSQINLGSSPIESIVTSLPILRFQIADEMIIRESQMGTGRNGNTFNPLYAEVVIDAGRFAATDSEIVLASAYRDFNNLRLRTSGGIMLDNSAITIGISGFSSKKFIEDGGIYGVNTILPFEGGTTTIEANSIRLLNGSAITSLVPAGELGDAGVIRLYVMGELYLSDSRIAALVGQDSIGRAGQIQIKSDRLTLDKASSISTTSYNIFRDFYGGSQSGIDINATAIDLKAGSQIITTALGTQAPTAIAILSERGGDIQIQAQDLQISDSVLRAGSQSDSSTGAGGNISIKANTLTVLDQGAITAGTTGAAIGGRVDLDVQNSVTVKSGGRIDSIVASSAQADGGDVNIQTGSLILQSGGDVSTSTSGNGNAGNIQITARDRVSLVSDQTGLFASSSTAGRSGSITVTAPNVTIADRARVSVNNSATGDGGKLKINAIEALRVSNSELSAFTFAGKGAEINIKTPFLSLDQSALTAATIQGEGGNISLVIRDLLLLRRSSQISATANNTSKGGNIDISIPNGFVIAVPSENSDITANANKGRGGNISITAESIFGIVPRSRSTPLSDITASSDFGINGTVNVTNLASEPKPNSSVLPTLIDTSDQIAQTCSTKARSNTFVVTGKGGLPPDPSEALNATQPWQRTGLLRTAETSITKSATSPKSQINTSPTPLVEATHLVEGADGRVSLVAGVPVRSTTLNCTGGSP